MGRPSESSRSFLPKYLIPAIAVAAATLASPFGRLQVDGASKSAKRSRQAHKPASKLLTIVLLSSSNTVVGCPRYWPASRSTVTCRWVSAAKSIVGIPYPLDTLDATF